MKFNQPIFILGLSRSGTTILYKLLTSHEDTAYFDNYSSKFYKQPYLFRFIPLLMKYRKNKSEYSVTDDEQTAKIKEELKKMGYI